MALTETGSSAENSENVKNHFEKNAKLYETLDPAKQAELEAARAALLAREKTESDIVQTGLAEIEEALQDPNANPEAILSQLQTLAQTEVAPAPATPEAPAAPEVPAPPASPETQSAEKGLVIPPALAAAIPNLSDFPKYAQERYVGVYNCMTKLLEKPPYPRIMDDLSLDNIKAGMLRFNITILSATLDTSLLQKAWDADTQTKMKELLGFEFEEQKNGIALVFNPELINETKLAASMGLTPEKYKKKTTLAEAPAYKRKVKEDLHKASATDMTVLFKKDPTLWTEFEKAENKKDFLRKKFEEMKAEKTLREDSALAKHDKKYGADYSGNTIEEEDLHAILLSLNAEEFSDPFQSAIEKVQAEEKAKREAAQKKAEASSPTPAPPVPPAPPTA